MMRSLLGYVMPAVAALALVVACESKGPAVEPADEVQAGTEQSAPDLGQPREVVPKPTEKELAEIEELATARREAEKARRVELAEVEVELESVSQRANYAIGYQFGRNLLSQGVDLHPEVMAKALADAHKGEATLTDSEMQAAMMAYGQEMQGKMAVKADDNLKKSRAFLAENEQREGIKTTGSGLQYEIIEEGAGRTPSANDTVVVHYRGTLIDGEEFDSSYARGEPATFPVTGVISGWTETLQLMKKGAKWRIYLPPELAYGEHGAGGRIGPNEALIFDVELLDIVE